MNAVVRVLMVKGDTEWLAQSNPEGLEKVKTRSGQNKRITPHLTTITYTTQASCLDRTLSTWGPRTLLRRTAPYFYYKALIMGSSYSCFFYMIIIPVCWFCA